MALRCRGKAVSFLTFAALASISMQGGAVNETPATSQVVTSPDQISKPKLICQKEEVTGSRLDTRKTCLTAAQWQDYRRQLRLDVEHNQRMGMSGNGPISSNGKGGQ